MKILKKIENVLFDVLATIDLSGIILMCCADDIIDFRMYFIWWGVLLIGFVGLTLWYMVSPK